MRAALCLKREGNESLKVTDILSPKIVLGSVRVQVYAAGVNFADALLFKGPVQDTQENYNNKSIFIAILRARFIGVYDSLPEYSFYLSLNECRCIYV